ncbi:MAG: sugar phosphate isomerase/epimerase [Alphaproteobacteria bacterium]|nr:sugar phosphate isomerase/epimerase [Alphaproteobacteria bacterium]
MSEPTIAGFGFSAMGGSPNFERLPGSLDRFEALDAKFVELSLYDEDLVADARIIPERMATLKRICADRPFGYTVHGPICLNFMDVDHLGQHEHVCRTYLEACAELDARTLVLHTGRVPAADPEHLDSLYARQRETFARMGDVAEGLGVRIAVENVFVEDPNWHTAHPARLAEELAAIDHSHITGTLDFSHAFIQTTFESRDFFADVSAFAPQVNHLHVHDSFGAPKRMATRFMSESLAYGLGDLHLPIGWGAIQWDALLAQCRFRSGTVLMIELNQRYWSELGACADAARRFVKLLNDRPLAA